jgi:hypothetical protein
MNINNSGKSGQSGNVLSKWVGSRNVNIMWKIRNYIRPSFIMGYINMLLSQFMGMFGIVTAYGKLEATKITLSDEDKHYFEYIMKQAMKEDNEEIRNTLIRNAQLWAYQNGSKTAFGVLSYRVVTDAFVAFVVDQLQTETSVFGDFKFHDSGVGTTAENAADTAIETTDGESRATGTQTESAANAYRSVGTISYTTTKAITEHGLFNDASAGTLMDRSVFSAINVVNGDSIQFTYTITFTAGS